MTNGSDFPVQHCNDSVLFRMKDNISESEISMADYTQFEIIVWDILLKEILHNIHRRNLFRLAGLILNEKNNFNLTKK
jgi:hypothetical protein